MRITYRKTHTHTHTHATRHRPSTLGTPSLPSPHPSASLPLQLPFIFVVCPPVPPPLSISFPSVIISTITAFIAHTSCSPVKGTLYRSQATGLKSAIHTILQQLEPRASRRRADLIKLPISFIFYYSPLLNPSLFLLQPSSIIVTCSTLSIMSTPLRVVRSAQSFAPTAPKFQSVRSLHITGAQAQPSSALAFQTRMAELRKSGERYVASLTLYPMSSEGNTPSSCHLLSMGKSVHPTEANIQQHSSPKSGCPSLQHHPRPRQAQRLLPHRLHLHAKRLVRGRPSPLGHWPHSYPP
jgi:hypothetical protein